MHVHVHVDGRLYASEHSIMIRRHHPTERGLQHKVVRHYGGSMAVWHTQLFVQSRPCRYLKQMGPTVSEARVSRSIVCTLTLTYSQTRVNRSTD